VSSAAVDQFEVITPPSIETICKINVLHEAICKAARRSVVDAITLGEILEDCRKSIRHGDWMKWVSENLKCSYKTASRYISIWKHRDSFKLDTMSNLADGLTDLYAKVHDLSQMSEADMADYEKKREKRQQAEQRREEREEEAERIAAIESVRISPEEFERIERESVQPGRWEKGAAQPIAIPKEDAKESSSEGKYVMANPASQAELDEAVVRKRFKGFMMLLSQVLKIPRSRAIPTILKVCEEWGYRPEKNG
jgi:hypothetical protein